MVTVLPPFLHESGDNRDVRAAASGFGHLTPGFGTPAEDGSVIS